MYQEILLKYARSSEHQVDFPAEDARVDRKNPACGDELALTWTEKEGVFLDFRWKGQGCAISLASAGVLCAMLEGLSKDEVVTRLREARAYFGGADGWGADWGVEEMPALGVVRERPMRMACVNLAWDAVAGVVEV